jgi:succinate dehydrogenase / fumarate reductase iron-sulfur subunit
MGRQVKLRIWRGNKENGDFQNVNVEANEGEVVLDVIHRVQATQMPDLAVRWNCKAGKCGSCSVEINGKPRLACMTRMNTFEEDETITVTPLRAFPVIKDLVTDVSFNYKKALEIPAYSPPAGGGRRASCWPHLHRRCGQNACGGKGDGGGVAAAVHLAG